MTATDHNPRAVSLLPSATELLAAVGALDLLVGRSHECDWPASVRDRPVLTAQRTAAATSAEIDRQVRAALSTANDDLPRSLYTLDIDRLRALRPDLILTQDQCDVCSIDLETVRRVADELDPPPRIISLNPTSLEDVLDDLLRIGQAVGREAEADAAVVALRERYWSAIDFVTPYVDPIEVAFLEWMDPLFAGGHWTPTLIEAAGGRHSLNSAGAKSRQFSPAELVESRPDTLIICPCGYDLAAIRRELPVLIDPPWWRDLPAVRHDRVWLVDGNQMFNRPGPRLVDAFEWLVSILHDRPQLTPPDFPAERLGVLPAR